MDLKQRQELSFKEAEGLLPLPNQLKWLEVDKRLRAALWHVYCSYLIDKIETGYDGDCLNSECYLVLNLEYIYSRHQPANKFPWERYNFFKKDLLTYYEKIFFNLDGPSLLEFIQYTVRRPEFDETYTRLVAKTLDRFGGPHRLVGTPPTLMPITDETQKAAIETALHAVAISKMQGAKAHLSKASAALSEQQFRDAIRESIHAVESAVKHVTGLQHADLAKAMPELQKRVPMHPAFKAAVEKLYAYTSDEKGIRHALLESENDNVGVEEAIFMFATCASFVAYLSTKSSSLVDAPNSQA